MDDWMRMRECMKDAGCSKAAIERGGVPFCIRRI